MNNVKSNVKSNDGFTLLEVLSALLIISIVLLSAFSLLKEQWVNALILKNQLEANYAVMSAGKTVADEIRRAKVVEWVAETCELKVLPVPDEANPTPTQDLYFIADLDHDGTQDLYWKHLGVSQPIASYLASWESREVEPGLWDVSIMTITNGQRATWRLVIRQRVYTKISQQNVVPKVL